MVSTRVVTFATGDPGCVSLRTATMRRREARLAQGSFGSKPLTGACGMHARLRALGLQTSDHGHWDFLRREALDTANHACIHALGERDGQSIAPGAPCAPNAMHVVFSLHR